MENILTMAKEVKETSDNLEAARLLQSGKWITVQAAIQGDVIVWVMIRVK